MRLVLAAILAASILAGRIALSRVLPVTGDLGGIEIANILLALVFILAVVVAGRDGLRRLADPRCLVLIATMEIFLAALVLIDYSAGRPIDRGLALECLRLLITGLALVLLLDSAARLRAFLALLVVIGLAITLGDLLGWRLARLQLITGISTSRINLLVLGAAVTLYFQGRNPLWLAGIALAVFALLSGSMKIALLSAALALALLLIALLACARFSDATRILLAMAAGFGLSLLTGDIDHAISRIEASRAAPSLELNHAMFQSASTPEAVALCKNSQNPLYCASPYVILSDRTERLRLFSHAISVMKTAPLLGAGPGIYDLSLYYTAGGQSSLNVYKYPHNLVLNIGVTHGLLGMAALCLLLFVCLVVTLSTLNASLVSLGFLIVGVGVFVASMTGGDFYDARFLYLAALLAALNIRYQSRPALPAPGAPAWS